MTQICWASSASKISADMLVLAFKNFNANFIYSIKLCKLVTHILEFLE